MKKAMTNILKQIINLKASLLVNAFIFYFRKLWIVGKWLPESLYSSYTAKKALNIVAITVRQMFDFAAKPLYLLLFAACPVFLIVKIQPQLQGQEFAIMIHILFFLNCYIGSFGDNHIFQVSRDKVTFIKYMHMNARNYVKASLAFRYIPFFVYYLPCMIVAATAFKRPVWEGIVGWLMLVCFRFAGEAFQLYIFDKTGTVLSRKTSYSWSIITTGLLLAYFLPSKAWILPGSITLHPITAVFYIVFGGFCIYYTTVGYKGYEKKLPRSLDLNFLLSNMMKASSGAYIKDVEIKETDLDLSKTSNKNYESLKGYAYLNALFFSRHRRQLVRPLYFRLALIGIAFLASLLFYRLNPKLAVSLSQNLSASLLPSFVFLMYCITVADKACRAMFYNCDKDMLHYAYYRTPRTILKTFQVRLFRVSLLNIAASLAICLAAAGFCLVCGTSIFTLDLLLFSVTIILLSILFTAHHLCLYYIFQPYSESLQTKNPFFNGINMGMYIICLQCLQVKVGGPAFSLGVLLFTIVYILVVLVFVYFRAPKSFRVK